MQLSKIRAYFLLQALFIGLILLYNTPWLLSSVAIGRIDEFNNGHLKWYRDGLYKERMDVSYFVEGTAYLDNFSRNAIPDSQTAIEVRYLNFAPSISHINSFEENYEGSIVCYLVLFMVSTIIFAIPNDIIPKGSLFVISKEKPWIRMITG